jgi:pimeloyl-ACP methyl ester carboxylesterase
MDGPPCFALCVALFLAQVSPGSQSGPAPRELFVQVNGITLHYLDWDGTGEPLVFLTGFGTPAQTFDSIAAGIRNRFHVYALTRRGMPPSDVPVTGYDLATLVGDVIGFLDAKGLDRVHLVGHSLAGLEMTELATRWPSRVRSLVYFDAIADPRTANEALQSDPLGGVPATGPVWAQISRWWTQHTVDFSGVKAPVLALVATQAHHPGLSPTTPPEARARADQYWTSTIVPLVNRWTERFREQVPQARVVTLPDASHYFYIERSAEVLRQMEAFYGSFADRTSASALKGALNGHQTHRLAAVR